MRKYWLFEAVYFAIAVTTFRHTAWAAATVFEGPKPSNSTAGWWLTGILMAVAIDIGMFIVAWFLTEAADRLGTTILVTAFVLLAISSFYMQVLYAATHAGLIEFGQGVTNEWQARLRPVVEARILIVPLMLPLFATAYTLAAIRQKRTETSPKQSANIYPKVEVYSPVVGILALPDSIQDKIELLDGDELGYRCLLCDLEKVGYKSEATRRAAVKSHVTQNHPQYATWRDDRQ